MPATMPNHPRFLGVVFDMDGVLCDSEPFICEAATRMFAQRHGIRVNAEDFLPFVGAGENRYLGGVGEKYGLAMDLEADKKCTYEIYLEIIRGRLLPLAGVREFIAECRGLGMRLAVATSADEIKMQGNLRPDRPFAADLRRAGQRPPGDQEEAGPRDFFAGDPAIGSRAGAVAGSRGRPERDPRRPGRGARCLGLTTSFSAEALRAAGADWTAPDLAHVPPDVLGEG